MQDKIGKTIDELTVKELREESRKCGLKLESKGHKFTKAELIERLLKYAEEQRDTQNDIQKAIDEAGQVDVENNPEDEETWLEEAEVETKTESEEDGWLEEHAIVKENKEDDSYVRYARTLEEIEKKYGNRKKQHIYDNELNVGSFVVFVHYVEAKDGNIYKKLRTAKVTGVNRKKELVRVTTLLGTELQLNFEELLYIKADNETSSYPIDIDRYLTKQRTEKGRVLINEKFNGND